MPNLIEQQDLLKGLPDNRLAMLMQQPSGDIPPFLVAAEAQRRQAIRQQFSSGPQESVVDTLTKQLTNVPENIQAPMQTPPQMPPPQQAGVAALQPQQQMRHGGPVRRFNTGSFVTPPNPSIYDPTADLSPAEQMARTYLFLNPTMTYEEALQRAGIGTPLARPSVGEIAQSQAAGLGSNIGGVGNYSILRSPSTIPTTSAIEDRTSKEPSIAPSEQSEAPDALATVAALQPDLPTKMADEAARRRYAAMKADRGKVDTSIENQQKPTDDDLLKELQSLYGQSGPSKFEKAQKWFGAAQQFMANDLTTGQRAINALNVWGAGAADEARAQREADLEMKKALLQYKIGERDSERSAAAQLAKEKRDYDREIAGKKIIDAETAVKASADKRAELVEKMNDISTPPDQKALYEQQIKEIDKFIAVIMKSSGYDAAGVLNSDDMRAAIAAQAASR